MTVGVVKYRRAIAEDYPAILRLQSANFIANLSEEERKEGFLSAEFAPRQVSRMAEDLGTTLATSNGEVLAFLFASRNEFDLGSPVIAKMLATYDLVTFDGQPSWRFDYHQNRLPNQFVAFSTVKLADSNLLS